MNLTFYERPLFYIGQHYVSTLGLMAFGALFTFGLILARFLQSEWVRRLFSRFKLETNFIAIITTILSLASLVFFTITAINAAGLPLAWGAPLPGIKLSLINIFLLIVMLVAVFWLSSRTKRFLFTNLLANSGLNRSLQYALSQIISNIVLVIGVILVLKNTGIHLGALAVFAGAVGVGVGVGLQGIASNFISGSSFSRSGRSPSATACRWAIPRAGATNQRPQHPCPHERQHLDQSCRTRSSSTRP